MSFILDALKKSENDRQDSAPAEFTTVASGGEAPAAPRWLWVLGGLLLLNTIVLAFLLLKPDAPEPMVRTTVAPASAGPAALTTPEPAAATAADTANGDPGFSARVAAARRDRPASSEPAPQPIAAAPGSATAPAAPRPRAAEQPTLLLPTLTELRAEGSVNLPDMHLDIHVYSEVPEDRFVFINMNKYRERSDTKEGPRIREIKLEGVVLDYQGTTFLLPRE